MSLWNKPINQISFESFIENNNSLIFDEHIWKNNWLWKIAEVTYSYDLETNINETLFVKLGLLDLEKYKRLTHNHLREELLVEAWNQLENILKEKIILIMHYYKPIKKKISRIYLK